MAFDFYAACNALAARYAPGTIPTPTGEQPMRASYGQDPNGISQSPCVVVFPKDGDLVYGNGDKTGTYRVDVNFYVGKSTADYKRLETTRQRWLVPLLAAVEGQSTLGLGGSGLVQKAIPTTWEFAQLLYGDFTWDGIVIHFEITTLEPATLVP